MTLKPLITKIHAATTTVSPTVPTTIGGIVMWITNWMIGVGLGVSLIMLILAFIGFATSSGDEDKAKKAQDQLTYAVIGGVGVFLIFALRTIILKIVGVNLKDIPGWEDVSQ